VRNRGEDGARAQVHVGRDVRVAVLGDPCGVIETGLGSTGS
jgi:hypothetical protein